MPGRRGTGAGTVLTDLVALPRSVARRASSAGGLRRDRRSPRPALSPHAAFDQERSAMVVVNRSSRTSIGAVVAGPARPRMRAQSPQRRLTAVKEAGQSDHTRSTGESSISRAMRVHRLRGSLWMVATGTRGCMSRRRWPGRSAPTRRRLPRTRLGPALSPVEVTAAWWRVPRSFRRCRSVMRGAGDRQLERPFGTWTLWTLATLLWMIFCALPGFARSAAP